MPILIHTLISMFGLGLMIAGISIIVKQVQAFLQILQFILAGLTFVSLGKVPWLAYFPFVKGVNLLRGAWLVGSGLAKWGWGVIGWLGLTAFTTFPLGWPSFWNGG